MSDTFDTFRVICEGSSDDTFGVYGGGINADYDNCASGEPIAFRITGGGESLVVVGQYAPGPCGGWLVGVAPDGEDDTPIPEWPMRFTRSERPYSPALVIEVPADAEVTYLGA
jgi:hypothetical protein